MKKSLFATSAIVAAAAAISMAPQSASAQDDGLSLGVGGYYNVWATGSTQDEYTSGASDFEPFDVRQEGEIHFTGEAALDNGIEVGVNVQLEAETTGDQIDEHYVYVEGSFGRVQIGAENGAGNQMHYAAPSVGILVNSPTFAFYQSEGAANGAPTANYVNTSGDENKLTYFTPRIAGFQLGASYAPEIANTGGRSNAGGLSVENDFQGQGFELGANYVQSFNGFDVALSGGYGYVEADEPAGAVNVEDETQYSVGLNVGYAGFTVGSSYGATQDVGFTEDDDQWLWDIGASYNTGPWTVGLSYAMSQFEDDSTGNDDERDLVNGGVTYALGSGVTAKGVVGWVNEENESTGNDSDGLYAGIGMGLSF